MRRLEITEIKYNISEPRGRQLSQQCSRRFLQRHYACENAPACLIGTTFAPGTSLQAYLVGQSAISSKRNTYALEALIPLCDALPPRNYNCTDILDSISVNVDVQLFVPVSDRNRLRQVRTISKTGISSIDSLLEGAQLLSCLADYYRRYMMHCHHFAPPKIPPLKGFQRLPQLSHLGVSEPPNNTSCKESTAFQS